jgi:hypothetical protein
MKMKTSELTRAALDWAVAQAEEEHDVLFCQRQYGRLLVRIAGDHETRDVEWPYAPSINWSQGGPIIERERIFVRPKTVVGWRCWIYDGKGEGIKFDQHGPTPLIAAMRCYVASKLGDDINIPEELL